MLLEDNYYKVYPMHVDGDTSVSYRIALLPECDIYRGHFPGRPVCPGACSIEIIKECVMAWTKKCLSVSFIKQCRFVAILTPGQGKELDLKLDIVPTGDGYAVNARLADEEQTYVEFKGNMTCV